MSNTIKTAGKIIKRNLFAFGNTFINRFKNLNCSKRMFFPEYNEVSDTIESTWGVTGDKNSGATSTIQVFRFGGYCSMLAISLVILIHYYINYPTTFILSLLGVSYTAVMIYGNKENV